MRGPFPETMSSLALVCPARRSQQNYRPCLDKVRSHLSTVSARCFRLSLVYQHFWFHWLLPFPNQQYQRSFQNHSGDTNHCHLLGLLPLLNLRQAMKDYPYLLRNPYRLSSKIHERILLLQVGSWHPQDGLRYQ